MRWRGSLESRGTRKARVGQQSELEIQGQEPQLPVLLRDPNSQAELRQGPAGRALTQDSEGVAWVIVPTLETQTKVVSKTVIEPDSSMNAC